MTLREALEGVNDSLWSDGHVSIRPIRTEADLIYATVDCQLTEAQRDLVNPAWFSIGRAYLFREDNLPCLIYADGQPVGFINLGKWLAKGDAWSWSFYVDKAHQGKGYGRRAARLALATERDNQRAQSLYASLGFHLLPERDGDDLVFGL